MRVKLDLQKVLQVSYDYDTTDDMLGSRVYLRLFFSASVHISSRHLAAGQENNSGRGRGRASKFPNVALVGSVREGETSLPCGPPSQRL